MVPGDSRAFEIYEQAKSDFALGRRIGKALGGLLADQHMNVPPADLTRWLLATPNSPRAEDLPNLPRVVADRALLARIDEALGQREVIVRDPADRVLTHSDLGFHNIAFHPETLEVVGVFDYDGAAFADRHFDFKNMSLHCADGSEPLLEAVASTYEQLRCRNRSRPRAPPERDRGNRLSRVPDAEGGRDRLTHSIQHRPIKVCGALPITCRPPKFRSDGEVSQSPRPVRVRALSGPPVPGRERQQRAGHVSMARRLRAHRSRRSYRSIVSSSISSSSTPALGRRRSSPPRRSR